MISHVYPDQCVYLGNSYQRGAPAGSLPRHDTTSHPNRFDEQTIPSAQDTRSFVQEGCGLFLIRRMILEFLESCCQQVVDAAKERFCIEKWKERFKKIYDLLSDVSHYPQRN